QKRIIRNGLEKEIPDIAGYMGMKRVADEMGPFLWLTYDDRRDEDRRYIQVRLIDPVTADDIFTAEVLLDYMFAGVNDTTVWYPLLNAVVDYLNANAPAQQAAGTE